MKIDFDVSSMDQQEAKEAFLKLELRKTQLELASKARDSFITFVKTVWPGFVEGEHHIRIGEKFEKVLSGDCLLYTSPSPRDYAASRMPSSA